MCWLFNKLYIINLQKFTNCNFNTKDVLKKIEAINKYF